MIPLCYIALWGSEFAFVGLLGFLLPSKKPSRAHQDITATIHSPSGNNNNHLEPIRK